MLAQIVADELGLKPQDIAVNVELDTAKDGWSIAAGNYASRFAASTCSAAYLAAGRIRKRLARHRRQGARRGGGRPRLPRRQDHVGEAAGKEHRVLSRRRAWRTGRQASLPDGMSPGLRETAQWSPPQLTPPTEGDEINTSLTYGFIFDFCGVEIDRVTGAVRIDRYVSIHDSGRILHPALAEGQIRGALAQAFGTVLYENFAYGPDGSLLSGTFADYLLPTAMEIPEVELHHMETPSPFTPLGAKGMGEGNTMSVPACLSNAVADALGVREVALPIVPARLAEIINGPETPPPAGTAAAAPRAASTRGNGLVGRGDTFVAASPQAVWDALLDPASLRGLIPGCESLERVGDNAYRATARLGIGPVRGTFTGEARFADLVPPRALTFAIDANGPLGSSRGGGEVTLEAENGGTRIRYEYGVDLVRQDRRGREPHAGERLAHADRRVLRGARPQRHAIRRAAARISGSAAATHIVLAVAAASLRSRTMKPAAFDYVRAGSVQEALDVLAQSGARARVLAGGQSLLAMLNIRLAEPEVLVDISRLGELQGIRVDGDWIEVGAATVQSDLLAWPQLEAELPLLARALPYDRPLPDPQPRHGRRLDRAFRSQLRAAAVPARARRRSRAALRARPPPRAGGRVPDGHAVDRARSGRIAHRGALPATPPGDRLRVRRDRAAPRRLRHRRARRGRERAGRPPGRRRRGGPAGRSASSAPRPAPRLADDALNAFAWSLGGTDDIHATARYRRDLVRRLGAKLIEEARTCRS